MRQLRNSAKIFLGVSLTACVASPSDTPLMVFQSQLQSLCGQTYQGRVTGADPQDENWRREILLLGPVSCPDNFTTILPLAVGSDQSRIWTLRLSEDGESLDFRHAHTLLDGSPDPVTGYGGIATHEKSTAQRAIFPVDEASKKTFKENGLEVSMTNVWSIDIETNKAMTYSLTREGRLFVAEFDLVQPR